MATKPLEQPQPRRSARLAAGRAHNVSENSGERVSNILQDVNIPLDKRRKMDDTCGDTTSSKPQGATKKPRLRKLRSLSRLPDMPLDVIFEIFSYLHPLDILHLARTTKALREILMWRSASCVWRQARSHIEGLPDCPPDLSEPQYANLLFDQHCHFCLTARVHNVMWTCRVRCCKRCLPEHFVDLSTVFFTFPQLAIRPGAMLPCEEVRNKLVFPKTRILELAARLNDIIHDNEKVKQVEEEYIQNVKAVEMHAQQLEDWHSELTFQRTVDRETIRIQRLTAITEELIRLGFSEELMEMSSPLFHEFSSHHLVRQPRPLTARVWANIKDELLEIMYRARDERRARNRCIALCVRLLYGGSVFRKFVREECSLTDINPTPADLFMMPEIRELVFRRDLETEHDVAETFLRTRPRFLELCERWRQSCNQQLLAIMPASTTKNTAGIPHLELATTWFRCFHCTQALGYPRVLSHDCAFACPPLNFSISTQEADLVNAVALACKRGPWRLGERIIFALELSQRVRSIIRTCGKDPDTVTAREMDELDARLVCRHCILESEIPVMSWRVAVKHSHSSHIYLTDWLLLNERDTAVVKRHEEGQDDALCMWICGFCRDKLLRGPEMREHFLAKHPEETPQKGVNYTVYPDSIFMHPGQATTVYLDFEELETPLV